MGIKNANRKVVKKKEKKRKEEGERSCHQTVSLRETFEAKLLVNIFVK